ncbi:tRNA pseudouridine(55) synthase TruB [Methanosarcinales archaeon]|nr:MAG: tRNA pseudouridine(55) synthase TruB [Methanosarcinales archaeon]
MDEYKNISGILVVDKPSGITSYQTVARIKKILNPKKIGHTGTLDPIASGLLLICLNEATKLVYFLQDFEKEYQATMKLGEETDTYDSTGKIISTTSFYPESIKVIEETFYTFKGTILQIPPMFSAIKKNGVPLYRLARKGKNIKREAKKVEIYKLEIRDISLPYITFMVTCSKGTYIRSLVYDIGKKLGCGAHLVALRRLKSDDFTINDAIPLDEAIRFVKEKKIERIVIPLEKALYSYPSIFLDHTLEKRVKNGIPLSIKDLEKINNIDLDQQEKFKLLSKEGKLIAIAYRLNLSSRKGEEVVLKSLRVFN